ncbi:hypothetical protein LguiA_022961 [Lonicera macranthoides]
MSSTIGQRFIIVFLLVLNAILAYKANSLLVHDETTMLKIHEQWMARHGRVYENKLEKETRFKIFKDNVEFVRNFNKAGNRTYKLAINRFADLTNQEFLASHTGNLLPSKKISSSTTYNSLAYDTDGTATKGFEYVVENGGITSDTEYPYMETEGTCKATTSVAARIKRYEQVRPYDEDALLVAVASQPVSVAVDPSLLHLYGSGIITGECGVKLSHAITAVGYGTDENGTKYWIFKNSWGTSWGENGYVRLARDIGTKGGMCGIAIQAFYPIA